MTHPATTRGLQDLGSLRARLARDYGVGRISWPDFEYISVRLAEVEERLVDIAAHDPSRLAAEARRDGGTIPQQRNEGAA